MIKFKKTLSFFLVLFVIFLTVGCSKSQETSGASDKFKPGKYVGESDGFGGKLKVEVEVDAEKIVAVKVTENAETQGIGSIAIEKLPAKIVEGQSIAVDTVSGATITSGALLAAVTSALEKSGVDMELLKKAPETSAKAEDVTLETDVVIIGTGGAGMSAAIEAKKGGASVIIVEKMPLIGGNTIKATGGMNASESHIQKERGGVYTNEEFYKYTFEGGHEKADPELLKYFVENSASAIKWLDDLGVNFTYVEGATVGRGHQVNNGGPVGVELVRVLGEQLKTNNIEPMMETTATEIIIENSKAAGIKAKGKSGNNITIKAKAVILATGGFGYNEELYTKYRPELKGFVTTNHPGATGDGIVMAEAVGADLTDIGEIQIHPTVEQETSELITEGLRTDGGILINTSGKRFFNETSTRDKVSQAILKQEGSFAYLVIDKGVRDIRSVVDTYVQRGFMKEFATVEEMAGYMKVDAATLKKTIEDWNAIVAAKKDPEFNREAGFDRDLSHAPYYVVKIAPGVHHTMGGVKINTKAQVISKDGNPITGLFAAGEVTGGIHGGNRIGGNAVTDIIIFGRTAGISALEYIKK